MMSTPPPATELQQPPQQALHYALANAQQVQIHQIGEDGQVQVVCTVLASLPLDREGRVWPRERGAHHQLSRCFWITLIAWVEVKVPF